jgi:site-specific recombinase XerD
MRTGYLASISGLVAPDRCSTARRTDSATKSCATAHVQYRQFLLVERALSLETANGWVRFIDKFLSELFGANALKLSELCATDVTAFIQRHAHRHSPSRARRLVTSMRSFLRYLRYQGLINVDLDRAVPKVARWSLSSLPKHLPTAAVQRVLDTTRQGTAFPKPGRRVCLSQSRP